MMTTSKMINIINAAPEGEAKDNATKAYREARTYRAIALFLKEKVTPVVHAAIVRNYPNFSVAETKSMITVDNWIGLHAASLGTSKEPKARLGRKSLRWYWPGGSPVTQFFADLDWGFIRGRIVRETGWSWEYVLYEVTLPVVNTLFEQFERVPPQAEMIACIAGALGWKPGYTEEPARGSRTTPQRAPDYQGIVVDSRESLMARHRHDGADGLAAPYSANLLGRGTAHG